MIWEHKGTGCCKNIISFQAAAEVAVLQAGMEGGIPEKGGRTTWTINFAVIAGITSMKKMAGTPAGTKSQEYLMQTLPRSRDAAVFQRIRSTVE